MYDLHGDGDGDDDDDDHDDDDDDDDDDEPLIPIQHLDQPSTTQGPSWACAGPWGLALHRQPGLQSRQQSRSSRTHIWPSVHAAPHMHI